ncbi:MAG: hypothetical protein L0177_17760 [Chloroflexi bacterium]|nr:hypothetical protein [Chloroflexota bacterium]
MIANKRQYEGTKADLKKLEDELQRILSRSDKDDPYKKVKQDGLRVWQKRLEAEIEEYERTHQRSSQTVLNWLLSRLPGRS